MAPRFSIVLPTYNRSSALLATIGSVCAQTERDWELLVVSDASTDDTDDVVRAVADPRVQLLRLDERSGHPGRPRNHGLAHAGGRYVAYLDHDDRWRPGHLTALGALLDGGARLAATGAVRTDDGGAVVRRTTALDAVWHPEIQVMGAMFEPSRVAHVREAVTAAGGWTEELAGLEDWELWLRLADRGERFATTAEHTVEIHTATTTRTHELPMRYALTVGVVPSPAHAQAALAFVRLPPARRALRALHLECARAWYADLEDLVLPAGVGLDDLPALIEEAVPDDTVEGLAMRPRDGAVAVVRPLACASREHAERYEALLRRRFAPKLRWLARALRAATPGPGAQTSPPPRRPAPREPEPQPARPARPPQPDLEGLARFHNPTSVTFGPGALRALGTTCRVAGTRALIVTDGGLAGGEIVRSAADVLSAAGVTATVFDQVRTHPPLATVREGAAAARAARADVVVGLGGGSSLDVAKAVALAAAQEALLRDPAWQGEQGIVAPRLAPAPRPLPLVQVPTTAATGAEVSPLASLTDPRGRKRLLLHPYLRARVALVDPELHVTLPARATAEGSAETLCRVAVPYLTERAARPLQDGMAAATVRVVLEATRRALADPEDVDARADLALAATSSQLGWAGLGRDPFGNVLFYLEHALATAAAATKGAGLAALLPAYLELVLARGGELPRLGRPERLAALGREALVTEGPEEAAAALTRALADWGLPGSLAALGVAAADAPRLADDTLALWGEEAILGWMPRDALEALYRRAAAAEVMA
ncbi:MAG TPA: iron-containing alcohol dehydrogenase [Solirubrobacteraceae bacterium]|jgi:alcohol dehydrogenase class IV